MILETIDNFLYWTADFAFNWTTFFWSIPIWSIILTALIKMDHKKVVVGDLPVVFGLSCFNPFLYCIIAMAIILSPIIILIALYIAYWKKIENKKIF